MARAVRPSPLEDACRWRGPWGRLAALLPAAARRAIVPAVALLASALPMAAAAQMTTGTIFGSVVDEQGGVIPGATVVLTSETRGTKSDPVVTSTTGDYVIPNVEPDTYTLEVSMSGFRIARRPSLAVSPGDRVAVPAITLEIGGATEQITVVAERPIIQAQSGERSFTIIPEEVQNLPIFDRTFSALAALAPGMSNGDGTNPSRLGGAGANNAMFDGVGIMETGSNQIRLLMNMEAVSEVKVLTSNYQAEYGRSSGVQISAVTKSGTNQFRGSIYEVKRNSDWNAIKWADKANGYPRATNKRDDWGYSIGGPLGRPGGANKLFFFFSEEWRPRTTGGQVAHFRVPTAAERRGDFSQTLDSNGRLFPYIRDPLINGTCSATNRTACFADGGVLGRIPADRLYPLGLNILNMWPLPNDDSGYAVTNRYNYTSIKPAVRSHGRQEALRGDYQVSRKLRVTGKLLTQDNTHEPNNANTQFGTGSNRLLPGFNDMVDWKPLMLQWSTSTNYVVNASTFFEASYGGFFHQIVTTPVDPASNRDAIGLGDFPMVFPDANVVDPRFYSYRVLTSLGSHAPPYFVNGRVLIPPTFSWGRRVSNPSPAPDYSPPNITDFGCCLTATRVQNLNLSLTRVVGRHTVKAGFYLDHNAKPQTSEGTGSYRGHVNFSNDANNPLDSGFGFANAALGVFTDYTQASTFLEGNYVYDNVEWYVQDNWKVTPKFTLDYGLRFVHQTPQYDTYGFASQFFEDQWDPDQAPALFLPACAGGSPCTGRAVRAMNPLTGEILGPGSRGLIGRIVPGSGSPTNGLFRAGAAPNVAENYTWPWLRLAPRFGYAWSATPGVVLRGGAGLFYDRPDGNSIFSQITNPPASNSVSVSDGMLQDLSETLAPPTLHVFQFDAGMPSSFHWNSGVQLALPWSSSLDISYVGLHGYNLLTGNVDINAPDFGSAYLPENHDPTQGVSTTPGAGALPTNFFRPFQGFGPIMRNMTVGRNNFHSLQTSFNRRFSRGVSLTLNYTLSRNAGTAGNGTRITRDENNAVILRDDQDEANYHVTGNDRTHVLKATFVWDLPRIRRSGPVTNPVGAFLNDWRLSGIFRGGSGAPYTVHFNYQNNVGARNLTGTPNYNARIVILGDPGKGCSSDPTRQFNTAAFAGPQPGSLGLESGLNYMRGCPDHSLDLAIARNIKVGSGRRVVQLRAELYNALNSVVFTGRGTTMDIANLATSSTAVNLPYDGDGHVIPARTIPRNAGFGVVSNSNDPRVLQLTFRFSF